MGLVSDIQIPSTSSSCRKTATKGLHTFALSLAQRLKSSATPLTLHPQHLMQVSKNSIVLGLNSCLGRVFLSSIQKTRRESYVLSRSGMKHHAAILHHTLEVIHYTLLRLQHQPRKPTSPIDERAQEPPHALPVMLRVQEFPFPLSLQVYVRVHGSRTRTNGSTQRSKAMFSFLF